MGQRDPEQSVSHFQMRTILVPLEHDKLLAKCDVLGGQTSDNIKPSSDLKKALCDEFMHPQDLHGQGRKFNGTSAYDYLRGTALSCLSDAPEVCSLMRSLFLGPRCVQRPSLFETFCCRTLSV